ncbi:MAG: hypothetical protein IKE01_03120 [Clostridia bacterium]|nr:hypothetical protein [Clostridia bacterium]
MKTIQPIENYIPVKGRVIELSESSNGSFVLTNYYENEFGNYEGTVENELTPGEMVTVFGCKTFEERLRRLHYYFKKADYISESAIEAIR